MSAGAPDLLGTIVAGTRHLVEARRARETADTLERQASGLTAGGDRFLASLRDPDGPRIIAECKRRSPSRGILRENYRPGDIARVYASHGAAAVSVLTEPTFFDGAPEHLREVRAAVSLPVLRKDFLVDRYQLWEAVVWGADAVLLIVAALGDEELRTLHADARALGLAVLVEVHDERELERAMRAGAEVIGVNNRNLRTLQVDIEASHRLIGAMPAGAIGVAESGLRGPEDIESLGSVGYRAFLIGETLMTASEPGQTLRSLRGVQVGLAPEPGGTP